MTEHEFTEQIRRCQGIIFKVIRLYVNHSEDEKDLYQEIMFQAWKSYGNFKGDSKFSTWLYRVSLNTVLSFKRRPNIVKTHEDLSSLNVVAPQTRPADEVEALWNTIKSLGEIDRMIITLHLDGYENEEIADISGLSSGNVRVKLHRIKTTISEILK